MNPSIAWLIQNISYVRGMIDKDPDKAKERCSEMIDILKLKEEPESCLTIPRRSKS